MADTPDVSGPQSPRGGDEGYVPSPPPSLGSEGQQSPEEQELIDRMMARAQAAAAGQDELSEQALQAHQHRQEQEAEERQQARVDGEQATTLLNNLLQNQMQQGQQQPSAPTEGAPFSGDGQGSVLPPQPPYPGNPPQDQQPPTAAEPEIPNIPHSIDEYSRFVRMGYATKISNIAGNRIQIRSLMQDEEILILQMVDKYRPTAQRRIQQVLTVAFSIMSFNDQPWITRQLAGPDDNHVQDRVDKIFRDLYPVHIDIVYGDYLSMIEEVYKKAREAKG